MAGYKVFFANDLSRAISGTIDRHELFALRTKKASVARAYAHGNPEHQPEYIKRGQHLSLAEA
ncbi:MAG: hypothetical protein V3T58_08310 [Candidatus Hydrothermarchaeales archaeon]